MVEKPTAVVPRPPTKKATRKICFTFARVANWQTQHTTTVSSGPNKCWGRRLWERHREKKTWRDRVFFSPVEKFKQLEWQIWQTNIFEETSRGCQVPVVDDISKLEWFVSGKIHRDQFVGLGKNPPTYADCKGIPSKSHMLHVLYIYIHMEYIPAFYHKLSQNVVCKYSSLIRRMWECLKNSGPDIVTPKTVGWLTVYYLT